MTQKVRAWHWLNASRKLGYEDGRTVTEGEWLHAGQLPPILCRQGMHASVSPLHALQYAPGPVICRVEVRGDIQAGEDKIVGEERCVLWMVDATDTLRKFARLCALDHIDKWDAPKAVVRYLRTGLSTLALERALLAHPPRRRALSAVRSLVEAGSEADAAWRAEQAAWYARAATLQAPTRLASLAAWYARAADELARPLDRGTWVLPGWAYIYDLPGSPNKSAAWEAQDRRLTRMLHETHRAS